MNDRIETLVDYLDKHLLGNQDEILFVAEALLEKYCNNAENCRKSKKISGYKKALKKLCDYWKREADCL